MRNRLSRTKRYVPIALTMVVGIVVYGLIGAGDWSYWGRFAAATVIGVSGLVVAVLTGLDKRPDSRSV